MEIRIKLPRLTPGLLSNLLGVAGLLGGVVAIGGLTNPWWALLAGSLIAVGLSYAASTHAEAEGARPARQPAPVSASTEQQRRQRAA